MRGGETDRQAPSSESEILQQSQTDEMNWKEKKTENKE